MFLSDRILEFFSQLKIVNSLPKGVDILNPYRDQITFGLCQQFYQKYYRDGNERYMIVGINPGRLGGGLTGIPFTDPHKLETFCQIPNRLQKKSELSAEFIYLMIDSCGGPEKFYSRFYFSSVSPLGFTMDGRNLNYYDIPQLQTALKPFIVSCLNTQLAFGFHTNNCFVLGEGKNYSFLSKLNEENKFFKKLTPLPHPRFVMQYKRKKLKDYVQFYRDALSAT
jgi:hypothetical protein